MKLRYLDGEKVYVRKKSMTGAPDEFGATFYDALQIFRHRDVVKAINRLFKEAEKESENVSMALYSIISRLADYYESRGLAPVIVPQERVIFDGPGKIRLAKEPRLRAGKPYVIKDVRCKLTMAPRTEDDGLSDEFRAFLEKERICVTDRPYGAIS